MALPAIYGALARIGMSVAKGLRPSKVSKALSGKKIQKIRGKQGKPVFEAIKSYGVEGSKQANITGKAAQLTKAGMKKGFQGYRKLYKGTLGTSTRRKVTSGTVGGYTLGSFLAGDDIE